MYLFETDHTENTHTPTEKRQHVSKNPKPILFNVSFPFVLFWKTHELQKEISLPLLTCFTAKRNITATSKLFHCKKKRMPTMGLI